MKLRRLRGFCVMSLLFFAANLISCSGQQQDQQGLESSQQDEGQDADQMQGQEDQEGEEESMEENEGQENFSANQGNFQGLDEGNNNLLANNDDGGNLGLEGSDNSLANIMNDMNMNQPDQGGDPNLAGQDAGGNEAGQEAGTEMAAAATTMAAPSGGGGGVVAGSAGPSAGPGLPEMGSKLSYIVVSGDTLAKISRRIYGTYQRWRELAEISGIENPGMIYPGDLIYYQLSEDSLAFASEYENVERSEVVVQAGETLETIAEKVYGSSDNWKSIWRQNGQIGHPDQLTEGTRVYIVPRKNLVADDASRQSGEQVVEKSAVVVMSPSEAGQMTDLVADAGEASDEEKVHSEGSWDGELSHWDV